jgi:hypothetical protein
MKQHITIKQLKKLTQESRIKAERYYQSTLPKEWDGGTYVDMTDRDCDFVLLWNIGQMIEYLDEHRTNNPPREKYWGVAHIDINKDNYWYVGEDGSDELSNMGNLQAKELCDALWEAVKEVLNHE